MPRLNDHLWSCSRGSGAGPSSRPAAHVPRAKAGDMISAGAPSASLLAAHGTPDSRPAPARRGPAGSGPGCPATSWHHHLVPRSLVLFSVGVVLALVLNLLQVQRNVTLFPEEVIATIFSSAWWVPPCCGTAAGE
ncbi:Insulin-induced gene 1 protein [Galemys pyrenaicus]|uniref:Insulin-induced gene 1 protein n=1 Tax=Galemys pyrenaicus TaxID=202257 RepID=A0A8J6DFC0_GALPY|nr:Insulin-induced gene 1 protein [Galemys pyrenaicus]